MNQKAQLEYIILPLLAIIALVGIIFIFSDQQLLSTGYAVVKDSFTKSPSPETSEEPSSLNYPLDNCPTENCPNQTSVNS